VILTFPKSTLGPVIDIVANPSLKGLEELAKLGRAAPKPTHFKMLIDTGADRSALSEDLVTHMGLAYTGFGWTQTMNATAPVHRYEVILTLFDHQKKESWTSQPIKVNARRRAFDGVPYSGVIGRDILDQALFVCNGPAHQCALAF
jgi:hypothetical protein